MLKNNNIENRFVLPFLVNFLISLQHFFLISRRSLQPEDKHWENQVRII